MCGWPIFGITLEIFGLLNLFGNMFPFLKVLIRQLPFARSIFRVGTRDNNRNKNRSKNERYYGMSDDYIDGSSRPQNRNERYYGRTDDYFDESSKSQNRNERYYGISDDYIDKRGTTDRQRERDKQNYY